MAIRNASRIHSKAELLRAVEGADEFVVGVNAGSAPPWKKDCIKLDPDSAREIIQQYKWLQGRFTLYEIAGGTRVLAYTPMLVR